VQKTQYYPSGTSFQENYGAGEQPYKFTGKELITMHGLNWQDFGARWLDNVRLQFTSMDPLAEKYYSISPYTYCAGNPVNKIDQNGMDESPIYDEDGNLLGTDNQGLKGEAIVMNEANFKQNMSHEDALKNNLGENALKGATARDNFARSYSGLSRRPDYDGVMSYKELLQWGRENGNSPVYLDASKIDFGNLYVSDFQAVGKGQLVNTTTILNTPLDTYGVWGKNYMTLISSDGKVILHADIFDYDQHSLSKAWKEGAGTWTYEFFVRHPAISILQTVHGVDDKFGFPLIPYGYGQLKTEPSFLMKIFNVIGDGASSIKP
jgi:RHS repeat-associated protein